VREPTGRSGFERSRRILSLQEIVQLQAILLSRMKCIPAPSDRAFSLGQKWEIQMEWQEFKERVRSFWDFLVLFSGISTARNISRTRKDPVQSRGLFLFRSKRAK
jgi:hypothetical protein